jgi:hypothetical protein
MIHHHPYVFLHIVILTHLLAIIIIIILILTPNTITKPRERKKRRKKKRRDPHLAYYLTLISHLSSRTSIKMRHLQFVFRLIVSPICRKRNAMISSTMMTTTRPSRRRRRRRRRVYEDKSKMAIHLVLSLIDLRYHAICQTVISDNMKLKWNDWEWRRKKMIKGTNHLRYAFRHTVIPIPSPDTINPQSQTMKKITHLQFVNHLIVTRTHGGKLLRYVYHLIVIHIHLLATIITMGINKIMTTTEDLKLKFPRWKNKDRYMIHHQVVIHLIIIQLLRLLLTMWKWRRWEKHHRYVSHLIVIHTIIPRW